MSEKVTVKTETPIGREYIEVCHVCGGSGVSPEPGKRCQCNGSGQMRVLTLVVR